MGYEKDYEKYLRESSELRIPTEAVLEIKEHWSRPWRHMITHEGEELLDKRLDFITITIVPSRVGKYIVFVKNDEE